MTADAADWQAIVDRNLAAVAELRASWPVGPAGDEVEDGPVDREAAK